MRRRWRIALALLLVTIFISGACRKNSVRQVQLPVIPGDDTIPVPGPPKYNQVAVHFSINPNIGGFYEALPPSYGSTNKKYPLLLFLHGGGELGDGNSQLPLILKNSVTRRLHEKTLPATFTVNGEEFSLIILSPQFKEWPSVNDVHAFLQHARNNYRVDESRIYVAGLSMGGGITWEYAGSAYGKSVAAIVPICGASWADSSVAKKIASNDVPGWAFHNIGDDAVTVNSTKRYVKIINAQRPAHPVKMTLWPGDGHDAWTLASDPEYREEGKNIYEWMLQFKK